MPENAYIQQAIATTRQQQKAGDYKLGATELFVRQMQQKMQEVVYNSTRSNLGF